MSQNDQNLVVAVQEDRIEDVRKYIEDGANIEYQDDQGINALIAATQEGHNEIVKLLLERGADINRPNADRQTPLLLAVSLRHPIGLIWILLDYRADVNPLPSEAEETPVLCAIDRAIFNGYLDKNLEILRTLIEAGAKVNKKTLMYAIETDKSRSTKWEENRKHVVNMILEEGVKANQKMIDRANELGQPKIAEMLGRKSSGSGSSGGKGSGGKGSGGKTRRKTLKT